jgi:hypothetical protein
LLGGGELHGVCVSLTWLLGASGDTTGYDDTAAYRQYLGVIAYSATNNIDHLLLLSLSNGYFALLW